MKFLLLGFYLGIHILLPPAASAVPAQPSRVRTEGRKILLQRRLENGAQSPSIVFTLNGLNWSPTTLGGTGAPEWAACYQQDLALIAGMNASVVRTYDPLPMNDLGLRVLDYCYEHNLYVIMNVGYSTADAAVAAVVDFFKSHPALLMFEVGNEWPYNFGYGAFGSSLGETIATVQRVAGVIRAHDGFHPVSSSVGNAYASDAFTNGVFTACSNVDVWGFNTYLNGDASVAVSDAASYTNKPFYFSEIGTDAFNNVTQVEDQASQSQATVLHWNSVKNAGQFTTDGGVCSGEVFFEFADEWWKSPSGLPTVHDNSGWSGPFYDGFGNEEWWGFVDVYRVPRLVHRTMGDVWKGINRIPDFRVSAISIESGAVTLTWPSQPSKVYQVQGSVGSGGAFLTLRTVPASSGAVTSVSLSLSETNATFFRVGTD